MASTRRERSFAERHTGGGGRCEVEIHPHKVDPGSETIAGADERVHLGRNEMGDGWSG